MMTTFTKFCYLSLLLIMLHDTVYASTCEIDTFDEKWNKRENEILNIFYLLNITDGSNYSEKFNVIFDVCEGNKLATLCNFIWKKQSNQMSVTNWRKDKDTLCSAKHLSFSRHVVTFDIHIVQLFRRPLTLLKLSITDSKESLEVLRLVALEVSYPPEVTSLTVNSHELGSDYVISEGEKVTVICSFNKGYPPSHFHLVDKLGQELQITRNEETISHSFSVECEDEWPIIGCEGEGSEVNRSVSFLVRCPPQFLDMYPKITRHSSHEDWTFNIKAYTTTIEKCLLTTGSSGKMSSKEVNCTLHGDPPHLVLTVRLEKEGQAERKHWTLTLRHEKGYSSKISGSDTVDSKSGFLKLVFS
ncbi:uncharacterized protein LOC112568323 [Pomacea canaliculata]|uniref:uncharacterized protein LOC112568323 n=1 Tax=Pomacea canaliculata TaxID=400727 RepID=UPI000D73A560|nr:uncharacterized protein LOC112568323 [Pomacea canaliculata]